MLKMKTEISGWPQFRAECWTAFTVKDDSEYRLLPRGIYAIFSSTTISIGPKPMDSFAASSQQH